jgi:hypothetical protein
MWLLVLSTVTLQNISHICSQLWSILLCLLLVHFASIKWGDVTEGGIVLQQIFLGIVYHVQKSSWVSMWQVNKVTMKKVIVVLACLQCLNDYSAHQKLT